MYTIGQEVEILANQRNRIISKNEDMILEISDDEGVIYKSFIIYMTSGGNFKVKIIEILYGNKEEKKDE